MEGNVRLFLLLYLMPFWSDSSSSLIRGLRSRLLIFYQDHMLLICRLIWLLVSSPSSVPTTSLCWQLISELWYCDVKGYATILQDVSNLLSIYGRYVVRVIPGFEIVWCICNSLLFVPDVSLGQFNHTNRWVEVLYCLDIYVGATIMTLGVLGSHLVI